MTIRLLTAADEPLLWRFLALAAHEDELETVRGHPQLARYAAGWGRAGDSGFVAIANGEAIGAAWLRLWPGVDKGFGYIAPEVPELAMAVAPAWRGRGVGTRLLEALLQEARARHPAVSLSVREENRAAHLYERCGFEKVPGSEVINRTGGVSVTMVKRMSLVSG